MKPDPEKGAGSSGGKRRQKCPGRELNAGRHGGSKDPGTQGLKENRGQRGSLSFLKFFFWGGGADVDD